MNMQLFRSFRAALLAAAMLGVATPVASDELKLVAENWPPYIDAGAMNDGFLADLITTAFTAAGYHPKLKLVSWTEALENARAGDYDVLAGAWYSREREQDFVFSDAFLTNDLRVVKDAERAFVFDGIESLEGRTVGIVKDYAYVDVAGGTDGIELVEHETVADALESLIEGRVELVVADHRVARYYLSQNWPLAVKRVEFLPTPLSSRPLHVAVSRNNPDHEEIVARFNEAIRTMEVDGAIRRLAASHRFNL